MEGNAHKYVAKGGSRDSSCRRAPHGARGLKLEENADEDGTVESRPTRGAWIETATVAGSGRDYWSRPTRGAWIETSSVLPST